METKKRADLPGRLFAAVAVAMSLFHLYTTFRPSFSPVIQQCIHLGFALTLVFLSYMTRREGQAPKKLSAQAVNLLLLAGGLYAIVYILVRHDTLVAKIGTYNLNDLIVGSILILVLLEATRRTFGIALPIIVIVSLLYARYGFLMPGVLYHAGFTWPRLIVSVTTNLSGVFGTILEVSSTYIVLFMIFGGMLESSGAGKFFIDFAIAVGGKTRSGAAQAAVISSCLVGSINGSAVANVASTGVFTIPLMKDRGYTPEFAGAVEACASTGGMIMPPVMGVGAFVMSGITSIPYATIALSALVPALLYYVTISFSVHLRALKCGFKPIPQEKIPHLKTVMLDGGHFVLPLVSIVYFMVSGKSVMRSALYGIVTLVVVHTLRESLRNPKFIFSRSFWGVLFGGMVAGAKSAMTVAAACAAMGIMTQTVVISGIAMKIVFTIKMMSGEMAIVALITTMAISMFFGMGVPTTASYILVAVLGAPVLVELGYPLLGIHLFIYYYAILANITPPVASAALVASQISRGNYMRTGLTAVRLGLPGFILPFIFVYHPQLLLQGTLLEIVTAVVSATLGMFCLAVFFEGYFFCRLSSIETAIAAVASMGLIYPEKISDMVGYLLFALLLFSQLQQRKRLGGAPAA
jgi:TRAP transporter 4TM/12TM fusion protein